MVPRVAKRGHSFKGAGLYYLHDKKADTKERVAWTYVHNLPTQDPEKALKWMAYTAMNAGKLKRMSGVKNTGQKASAGNVYCFSIAWNPEQQPSKETMFEAALKTLGILKLTEHEAVFVAHNDTAHQHVHVICNLVHPDTGKVANTWFDFRTFSTWAEDFEHQDGEILCPQRVINNERRRKEAGIVKYREQKLIDAQRIETLYSQSDSGKAFQAALMSEGYTLAAGQQRGFVLVDMQGKIYSLSRQLKGQRAADIKNRLKDVEGLQNAADLSLTRKHYHHTITQTEQEIARHREEEAIRKAAARKAKQDPANIPGEYLRKLDLQREWEAKANREKLRLEAKQEQTFKRSELLKKIQELEQLLSGRESVLDKLSGKSKARQQELEDLRTSLARIDEQIAAQDNALQERQAAENPDYLAPEQEDEQLKERIAAIKKQAEQNKERNQGKGREPEP